MHLSTVHHITIICSDYERSKTFYTSVLGLTIVGETYRAERKSWKLDLALNGQYIIELFSFPGAPSRSSYPEACGLRHLCFAVPDIENAVAHLKSMDLSVEPVRNDEITGKQFTFIADPDGLPIEFYEE